MNMMQRWKQHNSVYIKHIIYSFTIYCISAQTYVFQIQNWKESYWIYILKQTLYLQIKSKIEWDVRVFLVYNIEL